MIVFSAEWFKKGEKEPRKTFRYEVKHPVSSTIVGLISGTALVLSSIFLANHAGSPKSQTTIESGIVTCAEGQRLAGMYAVGAFVHLDKHDGGRVGLFQFPITTPASADQQNVIVRVGCFQEERGQWGITDQVSLPVTSRALRLVCAADSAAPRVAAQPSDCREGFAA